MKVSAKHAQPTVSEVTLVLTPEEAKKLRRVCYYNKTVSKKFAENQNGGRRKGDDILAFMTNLGNSLKGQGVERY